MPGGGTRRFAFDGYKVDTLARELRHGDGTVVPLTARAFDVLAFLIEQRDRVVSRDDLLAAVWRGRVVEENTLTQAIAAVRKALGTAPGEHRYLVTVPGHGYRFVADVREDEEDAAPVVAPRPSRAAWIAMAVVVALGVGGIAAWRMRAPPPTPAAAKTATSRPPATQQPTLAVLPFRTLSTGQRDQMLELGMADMLITRLSSATRLRVRSLASSERSASSAPDALEAARRLGARYLVEGTVQREGERVRVAARLLDVDDGTALWSGTFDERIDHVFTLQDALTDAMATALAVDTRMPSSRSPCDGANAEAYRAYLAGKYQLNRPSGERMRLALASFRRAIDLDPTCARAYAGLAFAYRASVMTGDADPRTMFPLAKAAVAQALAIDPELAEAHSSQAFVQFWYDWNWQASEASFRRAIALNPSLAEARLGYAHLLSNIGRDEDAVVQARQAVALDPLSPLINALTAAFLTVAGHKEEADRYYARLNEIEPDFWIALLGRAMRHVKADDPTSALADLRLANAQCGGCTQVLAVLASVQVAAGQRDATVAMLRDLERRARTHYVPASSMAAIQNALGDEDAALALLERGYAERDVRLSFLGVDTRWDNLRDTPRFRALMARMNFGGDRARDPAPPQNVYSTDSANVRGAP